MSGLNGRVRTLEREQRRAAGCLSCGGRMYHIVEPGEGPPSWLDGWSCCRDCGGGVKLIGREAWDQL